MGSRICMLILLTGLSLVLVSQNVCSGLDGVDIYKNNKLISTYTQSEPVALQASFTKPDTLRFHVWTSLEGLKNSSLDIKDSMGAIEAHIYGNNNTGYEADFNYVIEKQVFDDLKLSSLYVFFNLVCELNIQPQRIASITMPCKLQ